MSPPEGEFVLQSPGEQWSYRTVHAPNGAVCQRFELRQGDRWANDVARFDDGRQRVNMRGQTRWPTDTDIWFAYSFRWSGTFPDTWNNLTNFHSALESGETQGKPGPFSFGVAHGRFSLNTRSDARALTTSKVDTVTRYSMPLFPPDTWQHIVVRIKLDPYGDGRLTFWLNGKQRYDSGAIPIGYNDARGPYFKYGLYRGASDRSTVAEFANMELGTASLLDRVANPKPLPHRDGVSCTSLRSGSSP